MAMIYSLRQILHLALLLITLHGCQYVVYAFSPSSPSHPHHKILLGADASAARREDAAIKATTSYFQPLVSHLPLQNERMSISHRASTRLVLSFSLQSDVENNESESGSASTTTYTQSQLNDMKTLGNNLIMQAALECGATEPMVNIEWKADRIVVSVDVNKDENYEERILEEVGILMGDSLDNESIESVDMDIEWEDDEIVYDDSLEEFDDIEDEEFNEDEFELVPSQSNNKIDLTLIARTINELLAQDGEDSPAYRIAQLHEIEVTTPEFDNVLRGKLMFENYKGFDVMVEHWEEPKKKKKKKSKSQKTDSSAESSEGARDEEVVQPKLKVTEGKLVGRDYDKEVTTINVKGRTVKIKNDKIECVSLPKAKREKGAKY